KRWHCERRKTPRPLLPDRLHSPRHDWRTANARPDNCCRSALIFFTFREPPRLRQSLRSGSHRVLDEEVHLLDVLGINEIDRIEPRLIPILPRHQPGDRRDKAFGIKAVIAHYAALSLKQPAPEDIHPNTERRYSPHSGYDDRIGEIRLQHELLLCICT